MTSHYKQLQEEYNELQRMFLIAKQAKAVHTLKTIIKRMTEIDTEQAKMLHQPLNTRPQLFLNARG